MSKYVREVIRRRLMKYSGGEQKLPSDALKLNQNENEYPPSPSVLSALSECLQTDVLRLYPDQDSTMLKEKLSEVYGVKSSQVVVGNGSDEVIATVFRTVVEHGDLVVSTNPTYNMFKNYAAQMGAAYEEVDLNEDFSLPIDVLIGKHARLTAITNPNSPTGVFTDVSMIEKLAEGLKHDGILLVDEAYVEFAEDNALRLIGHSDNVVIIRTLSKSHSLAALRIGFAFGSKELITWMDAVKDPYNVGILHQIAAMAALKDVGYMRKNVELIILGRKFLTKKLKELGFAVYPSQANYVFFKCPTVKNAQNLVEALKAEKIYLRYFSDRQRIVDCIRVTVGTPKTNQKVIQAIAKISRKA